MKNFLLGCCLVPLFLLTNSCSVFAPRPITPGVEGNAPGVAQSDAENRIRQATTLLAKGMLDDAERMIAPLVGGTVMVDDVAKIAEEIRRRRTAEARMLSPELSAAKALNEVDQRLRIPDNYGRTVTIAKDSRPFELPPGQMENLINRKVSMHLENASVKAIITALGQVDGLNIIADQALTADAGGDKGPALTVQVDNVPLREILSYIARNMGIAFHLSENVIWVTKSDDAAGSGPQLETRIYRLRRGFIPAGGAGGGGGGAAAAGGGARGGGGRGGGGGGADDELDEALKEFMDKGPAGASYRIFKNRNLLVVKDTRDNLRLAEEIIREFDREPLQVLIEARFVTISQKDLKALGTKISELNLNRTSLDHVVNTFKAKNNIPAVDPASSVTTFDLGGIIGNFDYKMLIGALDEYHLATTLSAPRLTVLNNQSARIHHGSDFYYWEEWESTTNTTYAGVPPVAITTTNPQPSGAPTKQEIGVSLDVSVNIGNDGRTVMLHLTPDITTFQKFYTYGTSSNPDANANVDANGNPIPPDPAERGFQLPAFLRDTVDTSVAVNSGDTVVLGGTLKNTIQNDLEQTPWLGRLPIVGWLFKRKSVSSEPEHLLIFVTATVVGKSGEFIQVQE